MTQSPGGAGGGRQTPPPPPPDLVNEVVVDADDLTADDAWVFATPSPGTDGHIGPFIVMLPVEEERPIAPRGLVDGPDD